MSRRGRQAEAAELLSQVESGEIAALFQLQSITATPRPPPGLEPTAVVPIVAAFLRERVPEERDAARAAWMLGLSALANACVAVDQEDAPPSVRELFASHIAPVLARLEAALPLLGPIESAADHRPDSDPGSYPLTAVLRLLSNTTCSWIRPSYADVPELVRLAPRLAGVFAREKRLGGVPSGDQGVVSALLVSVVFNQSKDPQLCRAMLGEPACIDGLAQLWPTLRDPKLRVHLLEAVHQLGECALHAEAGGPSGFAVLASCASMGALVHEVLVRDDECIPSAAPASTHTFALGLATNLLNNEREAALKVLGHARVLLPVAEKLARATDAEQRELGAAVLDALLRDLASLRKLVADLAAADRLRLAAQGAHPVLQELGRTLALVGMPDASAPTPAAEHAKNFACHNAECSKLAQPGEQFKQCSGCRNVRYCRCASRPRTHPLPTAALPPATAAHRRNVPASPCARAAPSARSKIGGGTSVRARSTRRRQRSTAARPASPRP